MDTRQQFVARSCDKVAPNWTCSICCDIVARTKFRSTLSPKPATRRQCRRFRRQCRGFWRHCRWCGRGLSSLREPSRGSRRRVYPVNPPLANWCCGHEQYIRERWRCPNTDVRSRISMIVLLIETPHDVHSNLATLSTRTSTLRSSHPFWKLPAQRMKVAYANFRRFAPKIGYRSIATFHERSGKEGQTDYALTHCGNYRVHPVATTQISGR